MGVIKGIANPFVYTFSQNSFFTFFSENLTISSARSSLKGIYDQKGRNQSMSARLPMGKSADMDCIFYPYGITLGRSHHLMWNRYRPPLDQKDEESQDHERPPDAS